MKNRKLQIILNAVIAVISLAVYIVLLLGVKENVFKAILFSLLGLIAVYVFNALIHELTHVISGAISGLKPYSVQVLNLFIGKDETGKFKVLFKRSYGELGSTVFIPKTDKKVFEKYAISSLSALISNLLVLAVQCVVAFTTGNLFVYSFIGITFPLTLYILLVNLIPVFNNDGRLLYLYILGGEELEVCKNYYTAVACLTLGETPSNLNSSLLIKCGKGDYSVGIRYLRYLAYLNSDEEGAIKELYKISDLSALTMLNDEVEKELFFSALLLGDDKYVSQNKEEVISILEKQLTPADFRIHASFLVYSGESEWAKLVLNSGVKFCEKYPVKGLAKSEKAYMEDMLKQLNN
ncbi:MAG: hypothetical protein IKL82_02295 [Clostridia bacterium]|nr:hypothetical protein [Clostridia bacterium]